MKAAKRYAKALFELASDKLDAVENDMQLIRQSFDATPQLSKVLKDPTTGVSKKIAIVNQVFDKNISEITRKLIHLLGEKDRLELLYDISKAFNERYKKYKGIKEATVISAVALDDQLKQNILNKVKELTGSSEIKLTNVVDPAIIGGFILNMDDMRYDASISGKLAKIKSKLVE
jgi:F-type H+-transporting ATPase subunit delta